MDDGLLQFRDLGRIGYKAAFEVQREVHAGVLAGRRPPTVLLLEHEPVVTISKRQSSAGHLLAGAGKLARAGVEVCRTDRGGDITYHGPGQLVAYPIVPLGPLGLNLRGYIRRLEGAIIETAGAFGVRAHREAGAVGVWVDAGAGDSGGRHGGPPHSPGAAAAAGVPGSAKLAAIGVRVRRWVSMHGLALNVTTNLEHFGLIVPCGLARPVTSLERLLGERCPSMAEVKRVLAEALRSRLTEGAPSGA